MIKKNLRLISIFLVLLIIYPFLRRYIDAKRNPFHPLIDIPITKARVIQIYNGKKLIIINKSEDKYIFESPFKGIAVDKKSIDTFFSWFGKLARQKDMGDINKDAEKDFGISSASQWIELEFEKKKVNIVLGMRNPVAPQNYVYIKNEGKLVLTDRLAERLFLWKPEKFRDRKFFDFAPDIINGVKISYKKGNAISFNKQDNDWYLFDSKTKNEYLCDNAKTGVLLKIITLMEVADFGPIDNNVSISACGLQKPKVSLTVHSGTASVKTIDIGDTYNNNNVYASMDGQVAGGISAFFVKNLTEPTTSYFRYNVIDFPVAGVVKFTSTDGEMTYKYEKKRSSWYKTGKRKMEIDREKVAQFLAVIANLKAETFFFDNNPGEIKNEFVFYNRKGKILADILIGETKGNYAKIVLKGKKVIFGVPAYMAELLKI